MYITRSVKAKFKGLKYLKAFVNSYTLREFLKMERNSILAILGKYHLHLLWDRGK